jgi:hypothetical protein
METYKVVVARIYKARVNVASVAHPRGVAAALLRPNVILPVFPKPERVPLHDGAAEAGVGST